MPEAGLFLLKISSCLKDTKCYVTQADCIQNVFKWLWTFKLEIWQKRNKGYSTIAFIKTLQISHHALNMQRSLFKTWE